MTKDRQRGHKDLRPVRLAQPRDQLPHSCALSCLEVPPLNATALKLQLEECALRHTKRHAAGLLGSSHWQLHAAARL
jgi:hypothetical protein